MKSLEWLCNCCKNKNCTTKKILVKNEGNCKIIKCLRFIKDDEKIKKPPKFKYIIRSDEE